MNEPQVIKAVFYNWRQVVGHKRLQLIFEVPLEETSVVLKMLGAQMSDKETWCAIALLDESVDDNKYDIWTGPRKFERRAFCDLPMPHQAWIKSSDLKFQLWMSAGHPEAGGRDCASAIRRYCGVNSRADILPGTEAGDRWLALLREFDGVR